MSSIRNVQLELLRSGPAHNQLLSPLTPYIALCGSAGPVTVNMPFEHRQLLARLERQGPSSETFRSIRAIETLERIGTPGAVAVLRRLARGAKGALLTEEALAALTRCGAVASGE